MRALFEARLEDLGPGDLVKIECICGHSELLTASMLTTAGVKTLRDDLGLTAEAPLPGMRCAREGRDFDKMGGISGLRPL